MADVVGSGYEEIELAVISLCEDIGNAGYNRCGVKLSFTRRRRFYWRQPPTVNVEESSLYRAFLTHIAFQGVGGHSDVAGQQRIPIYLSFPVQVLSHLEDPADRHDIPSNQLVQISTPG